MSFSRNGRIALASLLLVAGGACQAQANDPAEAWNRAVFGFNEGLDAVLLRPVAEGYVAVTPEPVRAGVTNFFRNFRDGWSAINHLLQGKPVAAAQSTMRVATNTIFGIGGLFDVAADLGIERQPEDFGQTLGRWGFAAGPYVVWPLIGPSSVRDSFGLPLDLAWATGALTNDGTIRGWLTVAELIDVRAQLLGASRMIDGLALDKYVFIRDAYLARRHSLVHDGDPPEVLPGQGDGPREIR